MPHYGVKERFCHGDACRALERAARKMADDKLGELGAVPASSELGRPDQTTWENMLRLAADEKLESGELPTLGVKTDSYSDGLPHAYYQHSYAEHSFIPVVVGGRLLLGKIGPAGVSPSHAGSAVLFSAYKLTDGHLEPVAGFYLDVVGYTLTGFQVSGSP